MAGRTDSKDEISDQEFTFWVLLSIVAGGYLLVLLSTVFPLRTREAIAQILYFAFSISKWLLMGFSGSVIIYGFLVLGVLLAIAIVYSIVEKIYYWVKSQRGDDLVNEYQIK